MTTWRITVDHEACIGSAVCVGTLPSRFQIVNDKAVPVESEIEPDEDVIGAAESCPMEAILVVDAETGAVLAPEV
ncbi:MAG TPA: ferredoxin [Pseudonocardiaceae bacterium]|nr:ferredoxin [Pseudonocardiaceae bacterium]